MGDIFIYNRQDQELVTLDDEMIDSIEVPSVKKLLKNLSHRINCIETNMYCADEKNYKIIYRAEDITYCIVSMSRWRRGSGFICLQISSQSSLPRTRGHVKGNARVTAYSTNTIHHKAQCFGTLPGTKEMSQILEEYVKDEERVIKDLNELKKQHPTVVSSTVLYKNLKY